jgi:hypothetical protein
LPDEFNAKTQRRKAAKRQRKLAGDNVPGKRLTFAATSEDLCREKAQKAQSFFFCALCAFLRPINKMRRFFAPPLADTN